LKSVHSLGTSVDTEWGLVRLSEISESLSPPTISYPFFCRNKWSKLLRLTYTILNKSNLT
jgi:hypothetical protein